MKRVFVLVLLVTICAPVVLAFDDPLAQRDEWGRLTPGEVNPTDFEKRDTWRFFYYSQSGRVLSKDPAYVGALQVALHRKGYYCGPIDGVFADQTMAAICRLQKARGMRVDGYLSVSVRRALHLP